MGVFLIGSIVIVLFNKNKKFFDINNHVNFLILFELVTIIFCSVFDVIFDPNIVYGPIGNIRHLQPFLLGPVFIGVPLLIYKYKKLNFLFKNDFFYILILFVLLCFSLFNTPKFNKALLNYYPDEMACLDKNAKRYNLHSGIADYWVAKKFTAFKKSNIYISSIGFVEKGIFAYPTLETVGPYKKGNYNFVLIKEGDKKGDLDKTIMLNYLGKPINSFKCANNYNIYIYEKGYLDFIFKPYINLRG